MKRARSHRSWSSATARKIGIVAMGVGMIPLVGCGSLSDKNVLTVAGRQVTVDQFDDIVSVLEKTGTTDVFLLPGDPTVPKPRQLVQSITTSLLAVAVAEKLGVEVQSEPDENGMRAIDARVAPQPLTQEEGGLTVGDVVVKLDDDTKQIFWDFIAGLMLSNSQQGSPFAAATEESFTSLVAAAPEIAQQLCFDAVVVDAKQRAVTQRVIDDGKISTIDGFQGNQCAPTVALATFPPEVADVIETAQVGSVSDAIVLKPSDAQAEQGAAAQVAWIRALGSKKLSSEDAALFLQRAAGSSASGFSALFAFGKGWVDLNPEYGQISMDLQGQLVVTDGPPEARSAP